MGSTDKSRDPASLFQLLASFTNDGTPLEALLGSKVEWGVTVLTAGMLANENLAASMTPEEMVDGAINYYNLVQERLAYYRSNQVHSVEKDSQQEAGAAHQQGNIVRETQWRLRSVTSNVPHQV